MKFEFCFERFFLVLHVIHKARMRFKRVFKNAFFSPS